MRSFTVLALQSKEEKRVKICKSTTFLSVRGTAVETSGNIPAFRSQHSQPQEEGSGAACQEVWDGRIPERSSGAFPKSPRAVAACRAGMRPAFRDGSGPFKLKSLHSVTSCLLHSQTNILLFPGKEAKQQTEVLSDHEVGCDCH